MLVKRDGISIIVVNWNGLQWLHKLFDSLTNQTYDDYEIIMVDNGSSDSSVEFVEKNYSQVKIVKSESNLGFAGGNNLGIQHASMSEILLLNNDTWIEPDFLSKLYDFKLSSGLDIVGPQEATYDGLTRSPYITTVDPFGHPVYLYGEYSHSRNLYLSGVCILFSKELYLASGGLDDNFFMYFEEIDWFLRLKLLGKKFGYCSTLNVFHAGAGSGSKESLKYRSFLWRNENTLQMLLKNYKLTTLIFIIPPYFVLNLCEAIIFLFVKPRIVLAYVGGWKFNFIHLKRTLGTRSKVQSMRIEGDMILLKNSYKGIGKLHHLSEFIKNRINAR